MTRFFLYLLWTCWMMHFGYFAVSFVVLCLEFCTSVNCVVVCQCTFDWLVTAALRLLIIVLTREAIRTEFVVTVGALRWRCACVRLGLIFENGLTGRHFFFRLILKQKWVE